MVTATRDTTWYEAVRSIAAASCMATFGAETTDTYKSVENDLEESARKAATMYNRDPVKVER